MAKATPYYVIGISSVLALLILGLYFYQTSSDVTDAEPQRVVVSGGEEVSESDEVEVRSTDDAEQGITIARVRPDGSAVIAGNALEGSVVNLYNGEHLIGTTVVTGGNEWVIIPEEPFEAGSHLVTLEIISPDGTTSVVGEQALAMDILPSGDEKPLVALVPYAGEGAGEVRVLQLPEETTAATSEGTLAVPRLTIRSIEALNTGIISVSGKAEGGVRVVLSINDISGEEVSPDDDSLYAVLLPIDIEEDSFRLRGVLLDDGGAEVATASIRLSRGQIEQSVGSNALIVIQKGDALWRIAYRTYGQGIRYLDIYRENQSSIDDPDLIYPDQVFILPKT